MNGKKLTNKQPGTILEFIVLKPFTNVLILIFLSFFITSFCFATDKVSQNQEYTRCIDCHNDQVSKWMSSHHHRSMSQATKENVLADFSAQSLRFNDTTYDLSFSEETGFHITVTDSEKPKTVYSIKYTFGFSPLQQYLVETDNGKMQVLQIAWDSREKEDGGQKWFHILPNENTSVNSRLHWKGSLFNWNGMCADCHSSGLKRNYGAKNNETKKNSFNTLWNEINVSCQSCHNNAVDHLTDINSNTIEDQNIKNQTNKNNSTFISWAAEDLGVWRHSESHHTAELTSINAMSIDEVKRKRQKHIAVCAGCHSLRTPLVDGFSPSDHFLDVFEPSLVSPPHYFNDGQIKEEVYVYGSFLQSKMHQAGVNCTDCHDSHSLELKIEGNGVCLQCHKASVFEQKQHHQHQLGSEGSLCVNCHMPETSYMVVDPRRDHSLRIPRPDLSVKLGSPNACNQCHQGKTPLWASQKIMEWHGEKRDTDHYGEVFKSIDIRHPNALKKTKAHLSRNDLPDIIRASLLTELNKIPSKESEKILIENLKNVNPLVKLGALKGLSNSNLITYKQHLIPLLKADKKAIRIQAARILNRVIPEDPSILNLVDYQSARHELLNAGNTMAWRAEGLTNNAQFLTNEGNLVKAIELYKKSIKIEPYFAPAYINLSELYRNQGKADDANILLNSAISKLTENTDINHAYGLQLVRQSKHKEALKYLRKAAEINALNAHYQYVYAVALQNLGFIQEAQQHLADSITNHKYDIQLLSFALNIALSQSQNKLALGYTEKLLTLIPDSKPLQNLKQRLNR